MKWGSVWTSYSTFEVGDVPVDELLHEARVQVSDQSLHVNNDGDGYVGHEVDQVDIAKPRMHQQNRRVARAVLVAS